MPGPDDYDDGRFDDISGFEKSEPASTFRPGGRIGDELVELEGKEEHSTQKAILVEFTNGEIKWVPRSQIKAEMPTGDTTVYHVTEWWAKKNGMI